MSLTCALARPRYDEFDLLEERLKYSAGNSYSKAIRIYGWGKGLLFINFIGLAYGSIGALICDQDLNSPCHIATRTNKTDQRE